MVLTKDNYTVWSGRLKGILIVNKLWDLVREERPCPPRPRAYKAKTEKRKKEKKDDEADLTDGEESEGEREAISDAALRHATDQQQAQEKYDSWEEDFHKAACLLVESISDSELHSISSVMHDPIQIWSKLQQRFARRSEIGASSAQKALLNFQHQESESADETIRRFEAVVEKCDQQGVRMYPEAKERALLDQPNERYKALKKSWQYSRGEKATLEELMHQMRDEDEEYQRDATPPSGSVARVEMFQEELARAEIMWAQKYARGDPSKAATTRPAAAYTMCYCCGLKGHYARDCPEAATAKCGYCRKNGHKEKACKAKKDREESEGASSGGEASFFHGAQCGVVQFGEVFASIA